MGKKQFIATSIGLFVFLFFLVPTSQAAGTGKTYIVGESVVELRAAPDAEADIIGELSIDDKVTIFGEVFGWGRTFYNHEEAWVPIYKLIPLEEDTKNDATSEVAESEQESTHLTDDEIPNIEDNEKKDDNPNKDNGTKSIKPNPIINFPHYEAEDYVAFREQKKTDGTKEKQFSNIKIAKAKKVENDTTSISERPLRGYRIVIDPGHGGKDSGAISSGVYEKTLTLETAKKVADLLRKAGASVQLTRRNDTFISLNDRVDLNSKHKTDAFISLHFNAFTDPNVDGINTYYYSGNTNQDLANAIHDNLITFTKLNNRGTQKADFFVLQHNQNPAILIELGFMTNPNELKTIQTDSYKEKVANAMLAGLVNYFGE